MDRESRYRFARDAVLSSGEIFEARTIARKYRLSLMQGYMIKKESEYYNGQHLVDKAGVLITAAKL